MGIFVDSLKNSFPSLTNIPTNIIVANAHPLVVTALTVCNLGPQSIRFNLQLLTEQDPPIDLTFKLKECEIAPFATIDIIQITGVINLQYSTSPSISDSLVCFSNGYTQKFSCNVNYYSLNELPFTS